MFTFDLTNLFELSEHAESGCCLHQISLQSLDVSMRFKNKLFRLNCREARF